MDVLGVSGRDETSVGSELTSPELKPPVSGKYPPVEEWQPNLLALVPLQLTQLPDLVEDINRLFPVHLTLVPGRQLSIQRGDDMETDVGLLG